MVNHLGRIAVAQQRVKLCFELRGAFEEALAIQVHRERAIQSAGDMASYWIERLDLASETGRGTSIDDRMCAMFCSIRY